MNPEGILTAALNPEYRELLTPDVVTFVMRIGEANKESSPEVCHLYEKVCAYFIAEGLLTPEK